MDVFHAMIHILLLPGTRLHNNKLFAIIHVLEKKKNKIKRVEGWERGRERNSHQHSETNWLLSIDAVFAAAYARRLCEVRAALLSQIKLHSARRGWVLDPFLPGEAALVEMHYQAQLILSTD